MPEPSRASPSQRARYQRQITVIGERAQRRLGQSSVMIIGLGGLGNPLAAELCMCGVGKLVLNDFDVVELSNLSRQFLYSDDDIMLPKTAAAASRLRQMRADAEIIELDGQLDDADLLSHIGGVDAVLDCTDNFESRYAINRAARRARTPLISASAIAQSGQLAVFDFRRGPSPCYQCLFPSLDDEESDCNRAGIIAPVLGVMASMQAMEAIRILRAGEPLADSRFYRYNAIDHRLTGHDIHADPQCPLCRLA